MFTKPLNYIITKENLKSAYEEISKNSSGLDDVSFEEFSKDLTKNLKSIIKRVNEGLYSPEPLKKIEIAKPDTDKNRPIAISAIKDKILQRVLYENLNPYFDKQFSDTSYAYRPEKSTLKAINKVSHFINQKNLTILKTDIENYFETIDHNILLKILDREIKDKSLIRLISLFIQVGGFKEQNYDEHLSGVYQGDILSPLLSNIYLNEMDSYLAQKSINFVRYADDFVLLFKGKNEAYKELKNLKKFLKTLKLKLGYEKTKVCHISDGFTFLGIEFQGRNREVQEERLQKSLTKLENFSKNKLGFKKYIEEINFYLVGLKNYYLKILTKNSTQYIQLQQALINSLSHKVYLSKKSRDITTKKEFKILLEQVKLNILFEDELASTEINHIVAVGYEKYLADKSYKDTSSKIAKKKNKYAKKFANDSTLHIATSGMMLGVSKNKFVIKKYGKVQNSYPSNHIKRIVFEGKGFSLSTNVIKKCADNAISIDFINRDATNYASLVTYKSSMTQTVNQQAKLLNTPTHLALAKAFIRGKAKNQLNYLKYLNKYHKLLAKQIDSIEINIAKMKSVASVDEKKPTLTFDMIEEFRTFVVDRTIISMLNKDEPIKLGNDGLLTKSSRQLIAKNIKEKLGSYTMWKKESKKMENIIQTQSFNLAKVVNGELKSYKAFIGKY